ncbi:LOW QUALITY PROTEIN: hypothetical protein RJ641_032234 [Dillenia turbinata]|uniref:Phytocyanin domain-containing protein n=1 Tax=Dillenia turbinata TaxID=194707 RepID=A0AAN8VZM9_9MAGN
MGFGYFAKAIILPHLPQPLAYTKGETIVVGGSEGWHYGFNYPKWAHDHGQLYFKDTLVYTCYQTYGTGSNVTLGERSCWQTLHKERVMAYSVVLSGWMPYYFACGEGPDHLQGNNRTMKFIAWPFCHWNFY